MKKFSIKTSLLSICLLLLITAAAFVLPAAQQQVFAADEENYYDFAGGTGTAENPYRVETMYHLNNVRNFLDAYFIQTADIDLTEATAEGGRFYNGGKGWEPIGTDNKTPFTGNYDGGGHRIIGLKSYRDGPGYQYAGLFGYNSGIICNLGMESGTVSANSSSSFSHAGGIAGVNSGSITNCYITGTVFLTSTSSYPYAGGIAGVNSGSITNCYNTGEVSDNSQSSAAFAGGIAGYNHGEGNIKNCYNTGVSVSYYNTGGIAGKNDGSITNCYNTGTVTALSTSSYSSSYAGGITGYNVLGAISNCYNTGEVSSTSSNSDVGGIVGHGYDGNITNCYNIGEVSANSSSSVADAGGIAGFFDGTIRNCYWMTGTKNDFYGTEKTEEAFQNGEVTELLNAGLAEPAWKQDPYVINHKYPILVWQKAAVIPNKKPGAYLFPLTITLQGMLEQNEIYYTLDGTDPKTSESRMIYIDPITVSEPNTVIKTYNAAEQGDPAVYAFYYTLAQNPAEVSHAPGTYNNPFMLELSYDETDAEIYYTTDGSDPTVNSIRYIDPIPVYNTMTVTAVVKMGDVYFDPVSYDYIITPIITPSHESGDYTAPIALTLENSLAPDYTLYYTTDGSDPREGGTAYTGAIDIFKTTDLKVVGGYNGAWGEVNTFSYTFPEVVLTPSREPGEYGGVFDLAVSCSAPYLELYTNISGEMAPYTGPVKVYKSTELQVEARYNGQLVQKAAYSYQLPQAVITVQPAAGNYNSALDITLDCNVDGYDLYYTLDGSDPKTNGILYQGPFELDRSAAVKTAAKYGDEVFAEQSFAYELTLPTVSADMESGVYEKTIAVTLTCSEGFHTIWYTTDGSDPKTNGQKYTGPIQIDETTTLRAIPQSNMSQAYGARAEYWYQIIKKFAGGDGSKDNPYQVSTPEHLNNVREHLDAYFIQTADIDMTAASGSGWEPIGTDKNTPFTGSYDGGGHRIIGLKSYLDGAGDQYAGLLGYNKGVIRNLGMVDGMVSANETAPYVSGNAYSGSIAGYNQGTVENCYNTCAVSAYVSAVSSSLSTAYAGGIVGYNSGALINCRNTGEISSSESSADAYGGGVAGYNSGSITTCYNTGTVSISTGTSASPYAGGITAYSSSAGSITNCYNTGEVLAKFAYGNAEEPSSIAYAGGIAGDNQGVIETCYNTGAVSASASYAGTAAFSGGIAGKNSGRITYCYYYDAPNLKESSGTALTLSEMKQQKSYVGFDFDTVWSISPDKNEGYPVLRGLSESEDPTEPGETDVKINLSEKSYDEATGTYQVTVSINNPSEKAIAGTILVAAYDGNRLITLKKYPVTELGAGETQTIPAELTTNQKAEQLKVFFWNITSLQPLGNAAITEG